MSEQQKNTSLNTSKVAMFRTGKWQVMPQLNSIEDRHNKITLEPNVMNLLCYFTANQGRVLSKQELLQQVWGNTIVSDYAIARTVSQLRKALQDDQADPHYIQTIHKRGYQFIADVNLEPRPTPKKMAPIIFAISGVLVIMTFIVLSQLIFIADIHDENQRKAAGNYQLIPSGDSVISMPGDEIQPSVSASGHLLAYASLQPGKSTHDVFLYDTITDTNHNLTQTAQIDEQFPALSPSGKYLAYFASNHAGHCKLDIHAVYSKEKSTIADCADVVQAPVSWAPDEAYLVAAFADIERSSHAFAKYSFAQANWELLELAGTESILPKLYPKISPSGRYLAFRQGKNPFSQIMITPLDNIYAQPIHQNFGQIEGFAWHSDSKAILFCQRSVQTARTYLAILNTSKPQLVIDQCFPNFTTAADQPVIYYQHQPPVYELVFSSQTSTNPLTFLNTTGNDRYPAFSPDGNKLVFISEAPDEYAVWLADIAAQSTRKITVKASSSWNPSWPNWHPHNNEVIFISNTEKKYVIYHLDLNTNVLSKLLNSEHPLGPASYSLDGTGIFYSKLINCNNFIWKLDLPTNQSTPIANTLGYRPVQLRPNYLLVPTFTALFEINLTTLEAEVISSDINYFNITNWANWQGNIYYYNTNKHQIMPIVMGHSIPDRTLSIFDVPGNSPPDHFSFAGDRALFAHVISHPAETTIYKTNYTDATGPSEYARHIDETTRRP